MFECGRVTELDAEAAAASVSDCFRSMVEQETRLLELAAHWADLHSADLHSGDAGEPAGPAERRGREAARLIGGVGTPLVMEFVAAELGALQDTTTGGGSALMADALDLRHRLPQLWRQVLAGQVRSWRARKVAQATRHLSEEAAGYVDEAVAGFISSLSWSRFESLLQAKIVEADPADAEARARLWEAERFVRAGRSSRLGLKTLGRAGSCWRGDLVRCHGEPDRGDSSARW